MQYARPTGGAHRRGSSDREGPATRHDTDSSRKRSRGARDRRGAREAREGRDAPDTGDTRDVGDARGHRAGGGAGADRRPGPATFDELVAVLQERLPRLTPSQGLLAERVMADPEGVAFMTVGELAAAVDVNESTVVRFATSLGLDGYPGLTRLCRQRLQEQAQLLRRFSDLERLDEAGDLTDVVARAAAFDQANIARTLARVDRPAWSDAVRALAEAPRVHVLGLRTCYTVAYLLGHLLQVVRDDVATLQPGAGTLVDELRRVGPGDCFVGIAIHPYSRDTVRGFRWARRGGATTIALTDNPSSPLAREADHSFYVDTTGVAVLRSVTAFVSLAQALANAVAAERGARARSTLTLEEELLEEFQVYE